MREYRNKEFNSIILDILELSEFNKLKDCVHHGIDRHNHSLRVSYYTYKITKFFRLNYKSATRAALLHDFFIDEVKDLNGLKRLQKHPYYALKNAKKYFKLSKLEEDIIITHMFPITIRPPRYIESFLVDLIDDVASIYERCYSSMCYLKKAFNIYL